MSKLNIEKSKLQNSPIIVDSFNESKKSGGKKKFFDRSYVKGFIITVAGGLLVLIVWFLISNPKNMKNDELQPKVNIQESHLEKSPVIIDSPGATVSISDTDQKIQTISIEAKLLGTRKVSIEDPPPSADIITFGENSNAKLGDATLLFQSPVFFKTSGNEIEITNNFSLKPGSSLQHQNIESIIKSQLLSVPIITGAFSNSIETIKRFSVIVKLNGNEILKNSYQYNEPWPVGQTPTISIPIVYTGASEEPK